MRKLYCDKEELKTLKKLVLETRPLPGDVPVVVMTIPEFEEKLRLARKLDCTVGEILKELGLDD